MDNDMQMRVSPICLKNGKKYAFVSFSDGIREAEGKIPDCVIVSNKGFSQHEIIQLQIYMKKELVNLKKMAAGVNVIGAFMKS